jgi:hypothetical protein
MIRSLRRRHRLLITLLAVVVPAVFVLALAARPTMPRVAELPGAVPPFPSPAPVAGQWDGLFEPLPVTLRLLEGTAGRWVELVARRPLAEPDPLLYWSSGGAVVGAALPGDAVLLGRLGDGPLALPAEAEVGEMVIYSLAHYEVAAAAPLPPVASGQGS